MGLYFQNAIVYGKVIEKDDETGNGNGKIILNFRNFKLVSYNENLHFKLPNLGQLVNTLYHDISATEPQRTSVSKKEIADILQKSVLKRDEKETILEKIEEHNSSDRDEKWYFYQTAYFSRDHATSLFVFLAIE